MGLDTKSVNSSDNFPSEMFKIRYRKLIGSLLYKSQHIRLNLTYAMNYLSRFQNNPTEEYYAKANRIIRYLGGTIDYGLPFAKDESEGLYGFANAHGEKLKKTEKTL